MDFIDEEDRTLFGIGEIGYQVLRGLEGGAAGDLDGHPEVAGNAHREGGLAQTGRTVKEDVPQRLPPNQRGVDGDLEPRVHLALPDHLFHPLRAEVVIVVRGGDGRSKEWFACHDDGMRRWSRSNTGLRISPRAGAASPDGSKPGRPPAVTSCPVRGALLYR